MLILSIWLSFLPVVCQADNSSNYRSRSYASQREEDSVSSSPNSGFDDSSFEKEDNSSNGDPWQVALMWLPNRIMDFIDIFRVDVGVGPAVGGVVRLTKYGQMGIRTFKPVSYRLGDFGRQEPILVEQSGEYGVGPSYVNSKDRKVCSAEFGLGLDVFLVGAYAGICFDEFTDFVAGIFTADPKHDDFE
ncbi:MAG: hypothetical protein GYA55_10870 [SAR324 cluster bacterium]|uniref:Uncharacterized protein n=1 Tax=SAR324 cluster bacterium TaxID=2024889 RepID=A0A7X9FT14_9DELT|nr:hypothetical protein [SAR324 cluster bacterium]